jgi:hypothetical protein
VNGPQFPTCETLASLYSRQLAYSYQQQALCFEFVVSNEMKIGRFAFFTGKLFGFDRDFTSHPIVRRISLRNPSFGFSSLKTATAIA